MRLDNITLIAVSSIKINETIEAIRKCLKLIKFGEVKLVTHYNLNLSDIKIESCLNINNINIYNEYIFEKLTNHIQTNYCLLIQYDSGILHPELWDDSWFNYDYIGAPWIWKSDAYLDIRGKEHIRVGNGGFSLRSKKLLDLPLQHNIKLTCDRGYWNEDGNICVYHRDKFLELGIKYAPLEVACKFSYENLIPENKNVQTFGFHKYLPREI